MRVFFLGHGALLTVADLCCPENTHDRVMALSMFSIVVLVGLGLWQVCHLRNFFKDIHILS